MRLNRGAVKLNEQELRNCLYRGRFNDLVMALRRLPQFLELVGLRSPHNRMSDAELVLRYFTLSANYDRAEGVVSNYAGKMKSALNRFCEQNKNLSSGDAANLQRKFTETVSKVHAVLGPTAFQRLDASGSSDGRVNRALMDCVMLGFEAYDEGRLVRLSASIRERLQRLIQEDSNFDESLSFSTSDKKRLEYRLNKWTAALQSVLEA